LYVEEDKLWNLLEISKSKMLEWVALINVISLYLWIINAVKLRFSSYESV